MFAKTSRGGRSRLPKRGIAGAVVAATMLATVSAATSAHATRRAADLAAAARSTGVGSAPARPPATLRASDQVPFARQASATAAARAKKHQAAEDAARAAAAREPAPVPATTSYQVSSGVLRLLARGLRLPVSSALLTGLRRAVPAGTLQTRLPAGPALPYSLPSGVQAPAFTSTLLRVDPASDTLTISASAGGAQLSVHVAHASSATLDLAGDFSGEMSVPVTLRGSTVTLSGSMSYAKGRVSASLSGGLSAPLVLQQGVADLAAGTRIILSTGGGLRIAGMADLGPQARSVPVTVSGRVASADSWALNVTGGKAPVSDPLPGLALGGARSGTVTVDHASVWYDVRATAARPWRLLAGVSLQSADVRYGNTLPSGGLLAAPGVKSGTPWLVADGTVALAAGAAGTLLGTGTVAANLAGGTLVMTGRQGSSLVVHTSPRIALESTRFAGRLAASASGLSGRITGAGRMVVTPAGGKATSSTASLSLAGGGLVAVFPVNRALIGLGTPGTLDTAYWASTAVPDFAAPGGGTLSLPAGISATAPRSATLRVPATTGGTAAGSAATASRAAALATATTATDGGAGSYTLSPAAYTFLTQRLGIPLGSSPTISGELSGTTLTLTVSAPGPLPLSLPAGIPAPAFGQTTITVDVTAGTLTLEAGATVGVSADLRVTIAHAHDTSLSDGTDLTATVTLGGVPFVAGATVSLTGSLSYTGGSLGASLTGSLEQPLVLASGAVTLQPGTSLSIATGTGLAVHGSAVLGSGSSAYPLVLDGWLSDLSNWSVSVSSVPGQSWQPLPGLTLFPSFTAALTDQAGRIGFDLVSDGTASWSPASGATLAVTGFEVANQTPAADQSCPQIASGDVWLKLSGSFGYAPSGLDLDGAACVNLASKGFQISTHADGTLLSDWSTVTVTGVQLIATGNVKTSAFSIRAAAHAKITASGGGQVEGPAVASFADGGILVGVQIPDLSPLDAALTGSGEIYLSNRGIYPFHPADYGLDALAYPATIGLQPGINVALSYTVTTLPRDISDAVARMGASIPTGTSLLAVGQLYPSGLSLTVDINFGTGGGGAQVVNASGTAVYLDDITVGFTAAARSSISVGGAAYLKFPRMWAGGSASEVSVILSAGVYADTASVNLGLSLFNWQNAFGVGGMKIDSLAADVGITAYGEVTVSLWADGVQLPDGWGAAIGLAPGARVTMDASFDPSKPMLNFSLEPGTTGVALTPLAVAYAPQIAAGHPLSSDQQNIVDSLQINRASFFLAPYGGSTASKLTIQPGIAVAFHATVAGVGVDVEGGVDVSTPSLTVDASVGAFPLGPVTIGGTHLYINASPSLLEVKLAGSFAYSDNLIFKASVGLHLASTANGASARFTVYAGLPSYLTTYADLQGTVYGTGTSATVSASARIGFLINGSRFGSILMTLNLPGDVSFEGLDDINTIVRYFQNANASIPLTITALEKVAYSAYDVLNSLSVLGSYGQSVLDMLFSPDYYYIWVDTSAGQSLVLDVPDSSQSANARVYTELLDLIHGRHRQAWRFVAAPGYSGWYEIVNYASGQCLTTKDDSGATGALLVQYPCRGVASQLWYTGGSPTVGPKFNFFNRQALLNGYWGVADVQSSYQWPGGAMEIWVIRGYGDSWNQQFRLTQAVA